MTITAPFELGYVQTIEEETFTLDNIIVNILKDSISYKYYSYKDTFNNLYPITPMLQLTKEEYDKYIELEKLKKEEAFKHILEIFKEVLNPEDFDYTVQDNIVTFIIKFESFIISNNTGASHPIKDLFIKLVYNISENVFIELKGIRKTLNALEFFSGYAHSHLNSSTDWNSFCLGDGDISVCYDGMKLKNNLNLKDDLRSFLYLLYPYLMWENLDATPWRYIQNVYDRERIKIDNTEELKEVDIKEILTRNDISNFINLDELYLQPDIIEGVEYLSTISKEVDEKYKCYYDDYLAAFYGLNSAESINLEGINNCTDSSPIYFKGKIVTLKVLPNESTENLSTFHRFISPKNREKIIQYIKSNFIKALKHGV